MIYKTFFYLTLPIRVLVWTLAISSGFLVFPSEMKKDYKKMWYSMVLGQ